MVCYHARIWRLLKKRGPLPVREIAEAIRHDKRRLSQIMWAMSKKGCAKHIGGSTHKSLWIAVGDEVPRNENGHAVKQMENLRQNMRMWRQLLDQANEAKGVVARPTWPQQTCELANCWPVAHSLRHRDKAA